MSSTAETMAASMVELVTRMVQPALNDLAGRTDTLHARIRELEVLAGIQPPSAPPEVKAMPPRMRWDETHETWRAAP